MAKTLINGCYLKEFCQRIEEVSKVKWHTWDPLDEELYDKGLLALRVFLKQGQYVLGVEHIFDGDDLQGVVKGFMSPDVFLEHLKDVYPLSVEDRLEQVEKRLDSLEMSSRIVDISSD